MTFQPPDEREGSSIGWAVFLLVVLALFAFYFIDPNATIGSLFTSR